MDVNAPYDNYPKTHFGEDIAKRKLQYLFRKANYRPSLMTEEERNKLIDAYDNSIRNLDRQIEQLISEIPEDTTVIIVGDHGELFGEYGRYEHPRKLVDELLEVPLIIKNREDKEVEKPVSTIDIAPTIAERYKTQLDCDDISLETEESKITEASCSKFWQRMKRKITVE